MKLQAKLGSSVNVIEDIRAAKRDVGKPDEIRSESTYRIGATARQIDALVNSDEVPVVFVDGQSNVWVLSAGGSGVVAFESADDNPLDEMQEATIEKVVKALQDIHGLKAKKAKKKKDDVLLGVVEPECPFEWPDIIADVEES